MKPIRPAELIKQSIYLPAFVTIIVLLSAFVLMFFLFKKRQNQALTFVQFISPRRIFNYFRRNDRNANLTQEAISLSTIRRRQDYFVLRSDSSTSEEFLDSTPILKKKFVRTRNLNDQNDNA